MLAAPGMFEHSMLSGRNDNAELDQSQREIRSQCMRGTRTFVWKNCSEGVWKIADLMHLPRTD